jgi:hypothetical protein
MKSGFSPDSENLFIKILVVKSLWIKTADREEVLMDSRKFRF